MTRFSISPRIRCSLCLALAVTVLSGPGIGIAEDDPEINVAIGAKEIFSGESVEYHVEIRNSKDPSPPDLTEVKKDFDVVSRGDESRNQSSTFIINGKVSKQSVLSHVYRYQLTPKTTGELTIPAVTATIGGNTLTSDSIPLRVIEPEPQDLVLAEIEVNHPHIYPNQQFTVTLRVLVHPLPNDSPRDPLTPLRSDPPHLQLNWTDSPAGLASEERNRWLQPLLADDGIGFTLNEITAGTGFLFDGPRLAVFKILHGRQVRDGMDGKPIRYFVYELTRTFTAEKTGSYTFGPAVVKGMFVAEVEKNSFRGKRLVTTAPAVTVDVREVPSPRPAGYCGAIGDYRVKASASPTKLRVGDPMTLTIDFERSSQSGPFELVSAPDLSANTQLMDDFDLIDKSPTGRVEGGVKKFAYAMRPKRPNVSIPALTISTFDPSSEQFKDQATAAIPLVVSEAVALTAGELVGGQKTAAPSAIKSRAQGIYQNITDTSELRNQRVSLIAWSEAAVASWVVAALLIAGIGLYRRRSSDPVWTRRQQARRAANRKLAEARTLLSQGQSIEALRQVRQAIIGLVADTRNRIVEGLTTADVDKVLTDVAVPEQQRKDTIRLLESIESAEYGASHSDDVASTIDRAATLVYHIAPRLERGA